MRIASIFKARRLARGCMALTAAAVALACGCGRQRVFQPIDDSTSAGPIVRGTVTTDAGLPAGPRDQRYPILQDAHVAS